MSDIKAGDYVKLVTDGGFGDTFKAGEIHKVEKVKGRLVSIKCPGKTFNLSFFVPAEAVKYEKLPLEVGATVRLKENGYGIREGRVGVITQVKEAGLWPYYIEVDGDVFPYSSKEFEVIKQEETVNNTKFKAGDIVEAIETASGVIKGKQYTVKSVDDTDTRPLLRLTNGDAAFAHRFKLVEAKAKPVKAKSQKINLEDVQVGDTIVAFRDSLGVECRRKGVVASIEDSVARTAEGNILSHFYNAGGSYNPPQNIFLLDRPELVIEDGVYKFSSNDGYYTYFWSIEDGKYAERTTLQGVLEATTRVDSIGWLGKVFSGNTNYTVPTKLAPVDLLDKTKTYVAHTKAGRGVNSYYLKHIEGNWHYTDKPEVTSANSKLEQWSTGYLVEGNASWEKPVVYEPEVIDTLDKSKQWEVSGSRGLNAGVVAFIEGEWQWRSTYGAFITVEKDQFNGLNLVGEYIEKPKPVFENGTYYVTEKNFPESLWEVNVEDEKATWKPLNGNGHVDRYLNYRNLVGYKTSNIVTIHKDMSTLDKRQKALALGLLGNTYESTNGLAYRVTNKGNVKARFADRSQHSDGWDNTGATLDHVNRNVKSGNYTKKN